MKKGIFTLVFLAFFPSLVGTAMADISATILKGKATGEKKAALFVSVVDDAGRPIKGLTKKNFKLVVEGEEVKNFSLEAVSPSQEPLSLILGVDISGSMRGRPFDETKRAIQRFLFQLDKEDFVSILSFGTGVKFLTDFIKEKDKIWDQVEPLRPVDMWTYLYDATYEAIEKAKGAPTSRVAVILLTDGRDEGSKNKNREAAVNIATGAFIPVFAIGFGYEIDQAYLEEIARVSGGYFLFTPNPEEITGLYSKVLDQLKNQYMVSFDFTKEPDTYKANLTITHGGKTAKAGKPFPFWPGETDIPWYKQLTWKEWVIFGSIGVVLLVLATGWIMVRKWVKEWKNEVKGILGLGASSSNSQDECQLEFPKETPTAVEYIDSISGSKTRLAADAQGVFLKIDCLKGQMIPLVYQGREVITELIIARKDETRKHFKKGEAVYLWTPGSNKFVSAPKEDRAGNTRIFFLSKEERFAIEDLGSANGTLINDNKKIEGVVLLQDGDVIDVGTKQGIRIVYREGGMEEKESYEETSIVEL